jgi:Family of unknown function (DUF6632)
MRCFTGFESHAFRASTRSVRHRRQMILGVYATLGVFLLIASRNPLRHLSLIWFTVFSSVVHAGIMTAQALSMPLSMASFGDGPALFLVAALLVFLTPRSADAAQAPA